MVLVKNFSLWRESLIDCLTDKEMELKADVFNTSRKQEKCFYSLRKTVEKRKEEVAKTFIIQKRSKRGTIIHALNAWK